MGVLPEVYYNIMTAEVSMPCRDGFAGIFGIAFSNIVLTGIPPSPTNWTPSAETDAYHVIETYGKGIAQGGHALPNPLQQSLKGKLGIYWSGQYGVGEGRLYLDEAAVGNEHFVASKVVGPAWLQNSSYYGIVVKELAVGGYVHKLDDHCRSQHALCYTDTGNAVISVPEQVYNHMNSTTGALSISLFGGTGRPDVKIEMDAAVLLANEWVVPNTADNVILGLPYQAFYYTVFDIAEGSVKFVPNAVVPRGLVERQ